MCVCVWSSRNSFLESHSACQSRSSCPYTHTYLTSLSTIPLYQRLRHSIWIQRDAKSFIYGYLQMIIACLFTSMLYLESTRYICIYIYIWRCNRLLCNGGKTNTKTHWVIFNLLRKSHTHTHTQPLEWHVNIIVGGLYDLHVPKVWKLYECMSTNCAIWL